MITSTIRKSPETLAVRPNMPDYAAACATFSWDAARAELVGAARPAGLNIAALAVGRQAEGPLAERAAFRFLGRDGTVRELRFRELREQTNRFANVLRGLGVGKGERVFALTGRIPAHYVAVLGTLKNQSESFPNHQPTYRPT